MGMTFYDYNHWTPFLPGILRDTFIAKVTESIGNAYFRLGLILVVTSAFLERLEINHVKDCWRITFEMLCRWRETSPNRKNLETTVEELTRIYRQFLSFYI